MIIHVCSEGLGMTASQAELVHVLPASSFSFSFSFRDSISYLNKL